MDETHKIQFYPPKNPIGKAIQSIFPITNIFDGSTFQTTFSLRYSFSYPQGFSAAIGGDNVGSWYSPIDNLTLLETNFVLEAASVNTNATCSLWQNDTQIDVGNFNIGTGIQTITLNPNIDVNFGDYIFMQVDITNGSYLPLSLTAIFRYL